MAPRACGGVARRARRPRPALCAAAAGWRLGSRGVIRRRPLAPARVDQGAWPGRNGTTAQASSPWPLGWTTVTASRCRLAARFRLGGPPHGPQRAVKVQRPGLRLCHHAVEIPPAVVRKCAGSLVDTTASAIAAPDPPVGSVAICVLAAWFSTRPIPRPLCRPRTVDACRTPTRAERRHTRPFVKHQPWPAESGASRKLTGTLPIFPHHSRGPVVCTAVPSLSTATVTGMSLTSNS
jgi:hypothetical protein